MPRGIRGGERKWPLCFFYIPQRVRGTDHPCSEAWRYTGPFTRWNRFKGSVPGLGIATVAFAAYCAYEWAFLSKDSQHGHAEEHH